jgi:hypothetical protein
MMDLQKVSMMEQWMAEQKVGWKVYVRVEQ